MPSATRSAASRSVPRSSGPNAPRSVAQTISTPVTSACAISGTPSRSEEHTSELQSRQYLVCRLLIDAPTTDIYPLSLHRALPISLQRLPDPMLALVDARVVDAQRDAVGGEPQRPEVLGPERAALRGADDQHPGHLRLRHQRDAQQIGRAHV